MGAGLWTGAPWAPRPWQARALPGILNALRDRRRGIVCAATGSGKSILMTAVVVHALPGLGHGCVIVVAPRAALVEQLAGTLRAWLGQSEVGTFYGRSKEPRARVVVCCAPSLGKLRKALRGRPVGLLVVDEAHTSESPTLLEEIPALDPGRILGFTATPFRSVPAQTVSLFDEVLVRYGLEEAQAEGALVPLQVLPWRGSEGTGIDDACEAMIREHGRGPGIVSAASIEDATAYAERLTQAGIPARAIHSRQTPEARAEVLASLKSGEIRAAVHVSLLAEGVDLPWLRWICLRRNVGARVRFLQEVGRVLRTDPEESAWGPKKAGVVLDPHMLLGRHGLTTTEALGSALSDAADLEGARALRLAKEPTEAEAVAFEALLGDLSTVHAALTARGMIPRKAAPAGAGWRDEQASEKQVAAVKKASKMTAHIPKWYRPPFRVLVSAPWALRKGEASDLLDVLYAGSKWARPVARRRGCYANAVSWGHIRIPGLRVSDDATCKDAARGAKRLKP